MYATPNACGGTSIKGLDYRLPDAGRIGERVEVFKGFGYCLVVTGFHVSPHGLLGSDTNFMPNREWAVNVGR